MLNAITISHIFVADQDKALDFYTKNLGFQKHADYNGPEGRFLTIALKDQGFEVLLWLGSAGQAKATPGLGTLLLNATDRLDYPILIAIVLLVAIVFGVLNTFSAFVIYAADPRAR